MKAKIAGAEIEYAVAGRGPAVLLFHAFPLGLFMWDGQAEALADTHQVIRFDARGFGASPPGGALLTMERIADDGAALLDHLGVSRAVVGGCSMGGYAAFAFVRRHADRLKGLVLQDTRAGADMPRLLGETTQKEHPEVVARIRERILAASPRGIADALAGLAARADSSPTLREIRVPTLVVCGAEDVLTPVAESEAMRKAVPGSRLEVIPKAGHLSNLEAPAPYNAALRSFLNGLPS